MPQRWMKPCASAGCSATVSKGTRFCVKHQKEYDRRDRETRGTSHQRLYTYRWVKYRIRYFMEPSHVFCRMCEKNGVQTVATEIDHIEPHRGNWEMFWDTSNHQPLCKSCHSKKTVNEDGGFGRIRSGVGDSVAAIV